MVTYAIQMSNVQEVAAEMGVIAKNIKCMLDELDASTAQHLAEWTSAARDAYNSAKTQWTVKAADMSVQAASAQASLASITDNYANAEYRGLGLFGG